MIKWLSKYQEDVEDEVKANLCVLPTLSNTKYITVHMLQVTVTPKQTQAWCVEIPETGIEDTYGNTVTVRNK